MKLVTGGKLLYIALSQAAQARPLGPGHHVLGSWLAQALRQGSGAGGPALHQHGHTPLQHELAGQLESDQEGGPLLLQLLIRALAGQALDHSISSCHG